MKKNITIAAWSSVGGAIWFLGMVIVALLLFGCTCPQCDRPELKPLPPESLENLLFQEPLKNIAYKSITIKEIIGEKDFN